MAKIDKLHILNYQREYLAYQGSCIVLKSRQIGFSTMAAMKSVLRACGKRPLDTIYTATGEALAQQFIRTCRDFTEEFGIETCGESSQTLSFPNGSNIIGVSSSPKALHGRTNCAVILDEFSRHEDAKELLLAAEPIATWGTPIELISTVSTPMHLFWQTWNEIINGGKKAAMYKPFKVDIYNAVEQGLAVEIYRRKHGHAPADVSACNAEWLQTTRDSVSSYVWTSQYECLPSDSSSYVVPMSLYKSLATAPAPKTIPIGSEELFGGLDVGVTTNYTCLWIVSRTKGDDGKWRYKTETVRWLKGVGIIEQITVFKDMLRGKNIKRLGIDQGAQGHTLATELKKEFGSRIALVSFGKQVKEESAELVRRICESKQISLPTDEVIMNDICSMAVEETKTGNVSYNGGFDNENHCDCFWALAMALMQAENGPKPLMFAV